jgi:hypothetical protein
MDLPRDIQVLPVGTRREVTRTVVGAAVLVAHSISTSTLPRLSSALVAPPEGSVTLESSDHSLVSAQSHSIEPSR